MSAVMNTTLGEYQAKVEELEELYDDEKKSANALIDRIKELEAQVKDLRRGLDDMKGMYRVACDNRAAAYNQTEELEAEIVQLKARTTHTGAEGW